MSNRSTRRYRRLLFYSRAALVWEMLWPRLWPAAAILGVFVSLALLDVLPHLPGWLHVLVLTLCLGSVAACVVTAIRRLPRVDHAQARRRLELNSAPEQHRPLTAIEDQQAAGADDPTSRALWQLHVSRASIAAKKLTVGWPAPDMARREPWGIRAGVILLFAIAIVAAGREAPHRLLNAFSPGFASDTISPLAELWITPPAYTGQPPIFLSNRHDLGRESRNGGELGKRAGADPYINVLQGSTVLVRSAYVNQAPEVVIGSKTVALAPVSTNDQGALPTFSAKASIEEGNRLSVQVGRRTIAEWNMRVTPDRPPTAAFVKPSETAAGSLLSLAFKAEDDYQVREVYAKIRLLTPDRAVGDGEEIREPMPLTSVVSPSVEGVAEIDLTPHPWAGQPVVIVLHARDAIGQIGVSADVETVLPERVFNHPVARAVIAERKKLLHPSNATRTSVADALKRISEKPDHFAGDVVVMLSLSVVRSRLTFDRSDKAIVSSRDLLWKTALRLEEGDVPFAERALQDARQALWDALRNNAPLEEIERLIEALESALDRYLAAVSAEMARRGDAQALSEAVSGLLQTTDPRDIIDLMREFAQVGARDSARQLLGELQRMLQGLRSGLALDSIPKDVIAAKALAKSLGDLAEKQQQLLGQTFQRLHFNGQSQGLRQPDRAGDANGQPSASASQQQDLRAQLGEIMTRAKQVIGSVPGSLDTADQAMAEAVEAFQALRASDALANQTTALEALNQAIDSVNAVLAQRLSRLLSVRGSNPEEFEDAPADFFGRSGAEGMGGIGRSSLKIPNKGSLKQARQILEELRRKAGERHRPYIELEYFDRLLHQF